MKFRKTLVITSSIILLWAVLIQMQKNNACSDSLSYMFSFMSSNCYYIPDNGDEPLGIIKRHTGVGESHEVTTEDGYILTLFRIPQKNPKEVVILQHGILQDSRVFLAQYKESIALKFWNKGYDVWLPNSRGGSYSARHVNSTMSEKDFWDFCFHEMGYYDNDAVIKYVKEVTKVPKVIYVGYSMGSISGVIYSAMRPEAAANSVAAVVALAPYGFAIHEKTFSHKIVSGFVNGFPDFIVRNKWNDFFNFYYWFDYNSSFLRFMRTFTRIFPYKKLLAYFITSADGGDPDEVDPNLYTLIIDQYGAATSLKTSSHLNQLEFSGGRFQMYDYGPDENLKRYGNKQPPLYPLENINIPIFFLYATEDNISNYRDVELLFSMLPEVARKYGKIKLEGYGHHDYFCGIHRHERVFKPVFEFLDSLD